MYLSGNLTHLGGGGCSRLSDVGITCHHALSWHKKTSKPGPPRTVPLMHEGSACATAGILRSPETITEATATTTALITDRR